MFLASQQEQSTGLLAVGENIVGNCIIHPTAVIDPEATIGPNTVIGEGCKVAAGTKVSNSTLLAGSKVGQYSFVDGSIVGWKSTIGKWCRVTSLAVIAEDV